MCKYKSRGASTRKLRPYGQVVFCSGENQDSEKIIVVHTNKARVRKANKIFRVR